MSYNLQDNISNLIIGLLNSNSASSQELKFNSINGFATKLEAQIETVKYRDITDGIIISFKISYTIPIADSTLENIYDYVNDVVVKRIPDAKSVQTDFSKNDNYYFVSISYSSDKLTKEDYANNTENYRKIINDIYVLIYYSFIFIENSVKIQPIV